MLLCQALETYPSAQEQEFYGEGLLWLEGALAEFLLRLDMQRRLRMLQHTHDPIEHYKARIKTAASMRDKLRRQNLSMTAENAFTEIFDAAGVRIVCPFVDDIWESISLIKQIAGVHIINEKDYIRHPKPNGYRSYHMILQYGVSIAGQTRQMHLEVQLRTIAMDCWACLEHQIKYKHDIPRTQIIVSELKKCANSLASDDLSMQTIRDLISDTLRKAEEE